MPDLESVLAGLRRRPDAEATNLFAVDAADRLILDAVNEGVPDVRARTIAVIGDRYGALTLGLAARHGVTDIRVHQDSYTGEIALSHNAADAGLDGVHRQHGLDEALLREVNLVVMQLPRSLAELTEIAEAIASFAAADVQVFAGGRDKHMTPAMNSVLGASFGSVVAGRGTSEGARPDSDAPDTPVCEDLSDDCGPR